MRSGNRRPEHNSPTGDRIPLRRATIRAAAALGAVGLLTLTGCGSTKLDDISAGDGTGWPAAFHDSRNSATSPVTGSRHLVASWVRPVGAPLAAGTPLSPEGQMFVTVHSDINCVGAPGPTGLLFSFEMPTGRKRFCYPLGPDVTGAGSAVDAATNVYVGDTGGVFSFNALGQPRWRTPVAGVPISVQFTPDGRVLSVSQLGQVDVLERQTGDRKAPTFQVFGDPDFVRFPNTPRPPDGQGLSDCPIGGPQCPIATVSAVDPHTGRFYLTAWRAGAAAASLVALRYADGRIQQDWSADLLSGGSATSPTLSADGDTVYVGDNSGRLLAVNAADGRTKWTQPLGFAPHGAISAAGTELIPGGDDGHLLALTDKGDSVEIAWERKDLQLRGRPVQTAGDTGYVVAPIGDTLNLITFDTHTGTTLASAPLPGAEGTTIGTAVGQHGEVVVTSRVGQLFTFVPERDR